ncbi:type III polyketide synthase [Paenibacillus mucilaginosus]|uniref:Chalcone and stilbene synthase domain-containing protein n=2 Tax=Paenibacillus mucilaginosus TaxID=61624 RepID=H6NFX5_9BACL|nr:type III polyketide synthase [Paenibacillus mucilaginosus]WPM94679.1 chalcone synthase [Paenibacillus sp.]AEI43782.1 chalcone and stilbene synthase domain protein [Paenibacillus mucilaginosus KNP414]AFC31394.1 chalcone and stilbene synthase domain-containing protein [Paenibacillus mucilaginosus 3016]MCG7212697.1 type III polyketide synthase [Paenibacillus mucilaginosus]WDM25284.1 type III polyketide synthase [Paenibacillus mucilaginosus]
MQHPVAQGGAAILGIGTALPDHRIDQQEVLQTLSEIMGEKSDGYRWAKRIFKQCAVETRYTCDPRILQGAGGNPYLRAAEEETLGTKERMEVYRREALPLAVRAAGEALRDSGTEAAEVTHLITVSCTGQFLPGLDALLVRELGLSPRTNRIPLHFLGCAAGLKAVALAGQLGAADPQARILVVSVELCSLHIQPGLSREDLFAASFFGDGSASCVIGRPDRHHAGIFRLDGDRSVLFPDTSEAMTWDVGDHGFDLYLSQDIPRLLGGNLPPEFERFIGPGERPRFWAIHPGGRGIVDTLQEMLELTDAETSYSRGILRNYGNLSSATILFVLRAMREDLRSQGSGQAAGTAMAFGPGLTAELVRMTYLPAEVPAAAQEEGLYV